MMKVKCEICGKEFEAKSRVNKYCSKECRIKSMTREKRNERKKREMPKLSFEEIMRLARERGLTYGKVVALIESGKC